jgi:hypothetical protein
MKWLERNFSFLSFREQTRSIYGMLMEDPSSLFML